MKKIKFFALMSAIALTSAVGFTACSSSSDATDSTADVNPTFDGTSVRTDFAFNVTRASQGTTRMSATNVQATSGSFLGMTDMYLFPLDGEYGTSGSILSLNPTGAASTVSNYFLGSLEGLSNAQSSKVYSLSIPVGTDNFLFYAKAKIKSGTTNGFQQGRLSSSFYTNTGAAVADAQQISDISSISFNLEPITSSGTKLGPDATNIAAYLTAIANAQKDANNTWEGTVSKAADDGTYSGLSLLYKQFTSNYDDRSGSAESVVRMVLDLYKSAYAINHESSVSLVQDISKAICQAVETATSGVKVVIKNGSTEVNIDAATPVAASTADSWTAEASGFDATFPANLGLPMGVAQLQWNNKQFNYNDSPNYVVTSSVSSPIDIDKYCYPSELLYFDNSPLRATSEYKNASDYPVTTADWNTLYQAGTWPDKEVKSSTRAVAMTNNVNYGVSMLKTTVKLASSSLTDNKKAIIGGAATDQTIKAVTTKTTNPVDPSETIFRVTGLLIGGQPGSVGWNLIKKDGSSFDQVIFDNDITFKTTALSTSAMADADANYTLVLDNFDQSRFDASQKQNNVNIALQIVNDGGDFYGLNGMIPAGSTFYLVGTLDLTGQSLSTAVRGGTTYRVTNENITRVFCQDYTAKANITIAADALKKAYSTIPDLRTTEVLFGLSVDLTWEAGITFNVTM